MKLSDLLTCERRTQNSGLIANQNPIWVANLLGYEATGTTKQEAMDRAVSAVGHLLSHWSDTHAEVHDGNCYTFVAIPDGFACIKVNSEGKKSFLGIPDGATSAWAAANIFFDRF